MRNRRTIACLLAAAIVTFPGIPWVEKPAISSADPVLPQENWKGEFEDACSKTQDAMALGTEELKDLIARCDRLKPIIEKLDGPQRKVYLKRLSMCRDLFIFVLESKETK